MNLLDVYRPKQLALKTIQDISERRKVREKNINDYHFKSIKRAKLRRRKRS